SISPHGPSGCSRSSAGPTTCVGRPNVGSRSCRRRRADPGHEPTSGRHRPAADTSGDTVVTSHRQAHVGTAYTAGMAARRRAKRSQTGAGSTGESVRRVRMTGSERRQQLLTVARAVFAEKGFDGASIEEIAYRADVSKPVVYEHFGGKEGVYAVVVDRETEALLARMVSTLHGGHPRTMLEQAADALLRYVEESHDGFRILVRDSPVASTTG